jgi:RNA polymerase sigma-70 factor (ECF subfamily)
VIFLESVEGQVSAVGPALDGALRERLSAGRAAWPGLELEDEAFVRHLAAHAGSGELPPLDRSGDLFLACACAAGARGAASAFEKTYRAAIERSVARVDRSVIDEATQSVMVSLLVREGDAPPRIADYGGRAALRTWLATVAARAAIQLRRRRGDQAHESLTGLAEAMVGVEPELALAKARHGKELEESLRGALGRLDARQLVLLRLHHVKGWSVDRLGTLYRVGRSTAARWVAAAREAYVEAAKRDLRERLNLTPSELESLVALLQSNIELSLVRLLDSEE